MSIIFWELGLAGGLGDRRAVVTLADELHVSEVPPMAISTTCEGGLARQGLKGILNEDTVVIDCRDVGLGQPGSSCR